MAERETPGPTAAYVLSPYCVIHPSRTGGGAALVHALYGSRFQLSAELLKVLGKILEGMPIGAAVARQPTEVTDAVETLIAEKVLVPRDELTRDSGEALFKNRLNPVELAFHRGFNEGGFFPDSSGPPPAVKDVRGRRSVQLDVHATLDAQKGLVQCLLERRSIRCYASEPMPRRKLEQFLQLTVKAYAVIDSPVVGRASLRNYPSGGARYPLELYPLVCGVEALESGLYYYHPYHHRLVLLDGEPAHRQAILDAAGRAMGDSSLNRGTPSVLFLITAVVARTAWKYRGIPYHLILQEVGALYQTMYLAATLLELAPCAIGAFPELAVAEILGVDSRDEAQVGLFALGVPEASAGESGVLAVTDVRLLEVSPFSAQAGRKAVELGFADGSRETLDLADLRLERAADRSLTCPVMRGRHRAVFDREAEARLAALLAREGIPPIP